MSSLFIEVTYRDGRPWAAYIRLDGSGGKRSARSEEVQPEIIVDFDVEDRPIGIEIVNPGAVSLDEVLGIFDHLGLSRPDIAQLGPLHAA